MAEGRHQSVTNFISTPLFNFIFFSKKNPPGSKSCQNYRPLRLLQQYLLSELDILTLCNIPHTNHLESKSGVHCRIYHLISPNCNLFDNIVTISSLVPWQTVYYLEFWSSKFVRDILHKINDISHIFQFRPILRCIPRGSPRAQVDRLGSGPARDYPNSGTYTWRDLALYRRVYRPRCTWRNCNTVDIYSYDGRPEYVYYISWFLRILADSVGHWHLVVASMSQGFYCYRVAALTKSKYAVAAISFVRVFSRSVEYPSHWHLFKSSRLASFPLRWLWRRSSKTPFCHPSY